MVTDKSWETNVYIILPDVKSFAVTPLTCVVDETVTAVVQALKLATKPESGPAKPWGKQTSIVWFV